MVRRDKWGKYIILVILISTPISRSYQKQIQNTFSNGCLGSHTDEERSEMRYVMRIAKSSESSKLWTQLALPSGSMSVRVSVHPHQKNTPLGVLSESTVWSALVCGLNASRWNECLTRSNFWKWWLLVLVTILKPSNLRHCYWKFRMCLLKRRLTKKSLSKILIGPRISQEYPLNLSI